MKKYFIFTLIICSVFFLKGSKAYSKTSSLEDILLKSNIKVEDKQVLGFANFSSDLSNEDILKSFIDKNFKEKSFNIIKDSNSTEGKYSDDNINIEISVSNKKIKSQKYISIFYSHNIGNMNIIDIKENIRQMLLYYDKKPITSCQVLGKINNNLSASKISSSISYMLSNSNISFNKDYEDSSVSFSGYSSNFNDYILLDNDKINIQASGKYSSYDNCSYIWVASPVVLSDY